MSESITEKTGNGKWWAGFAAAFVATYIVDHMEKTYGIDFKELRTDPAVFKGFIEGSFVSFFVWLSPSHLVQSVTNAIFFVRNAFKTWRDALNKPN